MLTISDNLEAECTLQAKTIHKWCREELSKGKICQSELSWPINTTDQVISSLIQYFEGKEPTIKILPIAFANGHLKFCTKEEKTKILNALQEIEKSGNTKDKEKLTKFINTLE